MISVCGPKEEGYTYTEKDWNNPEAFGYAYSKVYAEKKAWELVEGTDLELLVVNPAFVMGPPLSKRTDSTSIKYMKNIVEGNTKEVSKSSFFGFVDVRDVAKVHVALVEAKNSKGRHITCQDTSVFITDMCKIASKHFSEFPITTNFIGESKKTKSL